MGSKSDLFLEEKARLLMELRGMGISSTKILSAIESIPREKFLTAALQRHAYDNASLPISHNQTISQPYIVARMTEALELSGKERVLEIGTGSGYQAAVLSLLSRRVYSIETLRPLLKQAEKRFKTLKITNVTTKLGDGAKGWAEAAPFDRILMTCAAPTKPNRLIKQLKIGGILVAPVDNEKRPNEQIIRSYHVKKNEIREVDLLPARFVPLISEVDIGEQ